MSRKKAALPFIIVTVLLDMLGIGLIIPVLPKLVTSMYGTDISAGSMMFGWFVASYALMQFFFSPILGNLSDRFGRRPVILLSLLGAGIDNLLMAFAPTLSWLFVGRIIAGISGASFSAASAYIADVSPPEERARNFGYINACFGVGFILGPALGGLLGGYHLRAPFMAAAVLNLCNALYGLFVLPESHPKANRRAFDWRRANPLGSLVALKRYPIVLGLTATIVLDRLAHDSLPSTWVLYTTYRFEWTELEVGLSLALVGVMSIVVSGGFTGPVVARWGERKALIGGLSIAAMEYLLFGLASQGWMLYAIIVAGSLGWVSGPAMQGLITKMVPADEQGALQGALGSLRGMTEIIGPLIATNLFGYFTSATAPVHVPGAAFVAAAVFVAAGTLIAIRNSRPVPAMGHPLSAVAVSSESSATASSRGL